MDQLEAASMTVAAAGWQLARAVLRAPASEAVFTIGPADGEPQPGNPRGLLGAVAQTEEGAAEAGIGSPALVAVHGLIDGLYNARPTLGRSQALTQALSAINRWMFARHGTDGLREGPAASLSAIIFSGTRAGLVQIGSGMILRVRAGEVARLTEPQLRPAPDGRLGARRSLGSDSRLLLDYLEEPVLTGDRYILLSDIRTAGQEALIDARELAAICATPEPAAEMARALAVLPDTETAAAPRRGVLVIDVLAMPEPTAGSADASLAELPLAPVPQEGENRDGYLIGRTLHRGAYTLLKHAIDTRTRQPVVLKFPLPAMLNDRVFQAGFARETWIGHTIRSPVIARVIAPEPGRRSSLYIVMPYYQGETLEARISREPRFSVAEIVAVALPLCQAVEDLRALQVLHRDLKPENVMLINGGGLRLLDLGLAYLAGVEDAGSGQGLAGTIRYMAPELLRGAGPDDRTEVYALGVILHRLAAFGRFPRPGSDVLNTLGRARPDLPSALVAIIAASLDQDPAKRPEHAGRLAEAVSEALQQGTGNRLSPRRFANPVTVWRSLALLLGLALLLSLALR